MSGIERRGLIVQDRDRYLLTELAHMRVIDREQARWVTNFKAVRRANARLLALVRAGLLKRFFIGTAAGGKKALYALTKKGAVLVGVPNRGPRRRSGETIVVDAFVQHQLAVNDIYCTLRYRKIPVKGITFVRWLQFFEPITPNIALVPDGYFETAAGSGETIAAFIEIDLGHESLKVWKAKIQNYLKLAVSGEFAKSFRQPRFRVLVIVSSERRLQSIRKLTATITDKIFWFATLDSTRNIFWSPVWLRPRQSEWKALV